MAGRRSAGTIRAMASSQLLSLEPRRARADRTADRWVTVAAIAIAAAYLVVGALSALLPADVRLGAWLPIHLAVAGASLTAVGGVMPFFVAALAAAPPAPRALRATVVLLLAGGVAIVAVARPSGAPAVAALGGLVALAGLAGLLAAAFIPLRRSHAARRRLIWAAYAVAILDLAVGISLAVADLAGERSTVDAWELVKPAHAWLNVLGFVSLVIAATLVHFLPTVAGTRIAKRRPLDVALVALAVGPAAVAAGLALRGDALVRLGAAASLVGTASLVVGVTGIVHERGRWTTDGGWHLFTLGSLTAAVVWFAIGSLGAAVPALLAGASPAAWRLELVLAPIAIGWTAQSIVGASAHLLPSIGPGDQAEHRALRTMLARGSIARLLALNAGTAFATAGMILDTPALVAAGLLLTFAAVATSIGLTFAGIAAGRAS